MIKFRNTTLCLAFFLFLIGPSVLFLSVEVAKIDVPINLTAENAIYLTGSKAVGDVNIIMTPENIETGIAQETIEESINSFIPARYDALLGYSAVQRLFIKGSSIIFDWDCFPTFFGSDSVYCTDEQVLMPLANAPYNEWEAGINKFARELSIFAREYPEKNFYVVMPDNAVTSKFNPSAKYNNNFVSTEYLCDVLRSHCEENPNVVVSSLIIDDINDYFSFFYKTDSHWNGYGAEAYWNNIVDVSGNCNLRNYKTLESYSNVSVFNGQLARAGLMLLDDLVSEPNFGSNQLQSAIPNTACVLSDNPVLAIQESGKRGQFSFYGTWYGGDVDTCLLNSSIEHDQSALIIGDSYSDAFRWIVANDYQETFGFMDLHSSSSGLVKLSERLQETNAVDVFFVGSPLDYSDMLERHNEYFSVFCDNV